MPHILEKIFFFLDYDSFKDCMEVNSTWKALLKSESYLKKGKALFHKEIMVDENRLYEASKQGRTDEVRSILSSGMVEVDTVDLLDSWGRAPLHWADKGGSTPLHEAAFRGHNEVVQVLLSRGADPNGADNRGRTPLHRALHIMEEKRVIKMLLEFGADPQQKDEQGKTPFDEAVRKGNREVLFLLIKSVGKDFVVGK